MSRPHVSADLNESLENSNGNADSFLVEESKAASKASVLKETRRTKGRSTVKSLRESIGFIATNKFGEGRRIEEDDDVHDGHTSIKKRQSEKIEKLGTVAAAASIFKAFVGLGVLFLPNQFWETGILSMGLIMVGSLMLTLYCTSLLLKCSQEFGDSYSEIAEAAYGPKMKLLVEICIIASQMAFCTNYVFFISSQMGSIYTCAQETPVANCGSNEAVKEAINLWIFMPILMVIYIPLVWIRSMEKLAFTHLISDVLIITVVTSVFVYAGIDISKNHEVYVNPLFTWKFALAIPYSAFAFEGVAVVLPLREIVEDKPNYFKLVTCVVTGICIFYIVFAEFCNFAYGAPMEDYTIILQALPDSAVITYTLKTLYTVNLFFSYPLMMSPAINLVESFIFKANEKPTTGRYWMQNLVRSGMVVFTIALAILVYSNIETFLAVVSATTCSPLAFTFPALFHYKLMGGSKSSLIIVILTTILTVVMTAQSIYALF